MLCSIPFSSAAGLLCDTWHCACAVQLNAVTNSAASESLPASAGTVHSSTQGHADLATQWLRNTAPTTLESSKGDHKASAAASVTAAVASFPTRWHTCTWEQRSQERTHSTTSLQPLAVALLKRPVGTGKRRVLDVNTQSLLHPLPCRIPPCWQ